mmetsp:Transcript_10638/g.23489  ORF Transcript_10638/g.23489 Transcript_10638/m.23489 type:complete len:311 (+) Transcript_10638:1435-2367(+)
MMSSQPRSHRSTRRMSSQQRNPHSTTSSPMQRNVSIHRQEEEEALVLLPSIIEITVVVITGIVLRQEDLLLLIGIVLCQGGLFRQMHRSLLSNRVGALVLGIEAAVAVTHVEDHPPPTMPTTIMTPTTIMHKTLPRKKVGTRSQQRRRDYYLLFAPLKSSRARSRIHWESWGVYPACTSINWARGHGIKLSRFPVVRAGRGWGMRMMWRRGLWKWRLWQCILMQYSTCHTTPYNFPMNRASRRIGIISCHLPSMERSSRLFNIMIFIVVMEMMTMITIVGIVLRHAFVPCHEEVYDDVFLEVEVPRGTSK